MKKILIICILIVGVLITCDIFFKKKIFNSFEHIIYSLNIIDDQNNNEIKLNKMEELNSFIKDNYLIMAFYIDHGEIERIKTQMVILKAGIEGSDNAFLHEEIERTVFMIEHLGEKIRFKLENIL